VLYLYPGHHHHYCRKLVMVIEDHAQAVIRKNDMLREAIDKIEVI
jgi:hypothetical protein